MEKCWFVLRQTHYPAPEYVHPSMAFGAAEGPIRLGHFIPSLKEIDQVINSDDITPFQRDMRIWSTKAVDFRFSNKADKTFETSAQTSVPIADALGVTANVDAGVVFKRMMGNTWAIDRLETQIVQPTMSYLEKCGKSEQVAAWVEKNKVLGRWKVYMISGLMIARGAKNERKDNTTAQAYAGGGAGVPDITTGNVKIEQGRQDDVESSGEYVQDFVWAVRLSEVSKSLFGPDLSQSVVTKGAVFAPESDNLDISAILTEERIASHGMDIYEMFSGDEKQFLVATIE